MSWWGVYAGAGMTLVAREALGRAGYSVFCPVERLTQRRRVAGRRNQYRLVRFVSPVFGRYLFAESDDPFELSRVYGVAEVVSAGRQPLKIPARVVSAMRDLTVWADGVGDLMSFDDVKKLRSGIGLGEGDPFRFTAGPFTGYLGVVASLEALDRSGVISAYVNVFGRQSLVGVHSDHVRALSKDERRQMNA